MNTEARLPQAMAAEAAQMPVVIDLTGSSQEAFVDWYQHNTGLLNRHLLTTGAVYLKGAGLNSLDEFTQVMNRIEGRSNSYLDGNSPRKKHNGDVYNASEYDNKAKVHLHTEYSYSNRWPSKLFFCCIQPALEGGQTTVADCRRVLARLSPGLVEEFARKGIRYIRNMHGGIGLGPSWMEAFETNSKADLERYCRGNDIQVEWKADGSVRIIQLRPAVRTHPVTGEALWFNQVDQFYPLVYGTEMYEALLMMCDNDEEALPMYATYGDGSKIQAGAIREIMEVLEREEIRPPWGRGDLLIVENMLALHGRMPFEGDRKVLVYMK